MRAAACDINLFSSIFDINLSSYLDCVALPLNLFAWRKFCHRQRFCWWEISHEKILKKWENFNFRDEMKCNNCRSNFPTDIRKWYIPPQPILKLTFRFFCEVKPSAHLQCSGHALGQNRGRRPSRSPVLLGTCSHIEMYEI